MLLVAALIDLNNRLPAGYVFGTIRDDAKWWSKSTSIDAFAYLDEASENLERRDLHHHHRKELFVSIWNSFQNEERKSVLDRVLQDRGAR
jgi:hypothetical protein